MSSIEDCKVRLIILNEWKNNNKDPKEVAEIVNERLDNYFINATDVQKYFKDCDEGNMSIFPENPNLQIKQEDTEKIDSLLLMTDDEHFKIVKIKDGRFMVSFYKESSTKYFICIYDLFQNVKKLNPVPCYVTGVEFIGEYLLAFSFSGLLSLIKINYDDLTINLLDSIKINDGVHYICPNQLNNHKFVLCQARKITKGQIQENKIVLDEPKEYSKFYYARFLNNKLHGFDNNELPLTKFREINLDTMEKKEIDVPIVLNDEFSNVSKLWIRPYCWSKNRFYGIFSTKNSPHRLFMFNLETLKRSNIGIYANKPLDLFIDPNEILTLQVGKWHNDRAFYRIPLRKPDTMFNLSWLTALRQSTLYENDKYLECAKRLPIQL